MTQRPTLDQIFAAPAPSTARPSLEAIFAAAPPDRGRQQSQAAHERGVEAANQQKSTIRNLVEGLGRGAESRVLGGLQLGADLLPDGVVPTDWRQNMADVASQLQTQGRGTGVGGVIGEIAGDPLTAATLPLASARTLAGLAGQGARIGTAAGLTQANAQADPVASRGERIDDALLTGAVGGAIPVGLAGVKKAAQPFNKLTGELGRLAALAKQSGIELTPAQLTGSKTLRRVENAFAELPLTSGKQAEIAASQAKQFNRAVLAKAGIDADVATPDVLAAGKKQLGDTFQALSQATTVGVDDALLTRLGQIEREATRRMGGDDAKAVTSVIEDVLGSGGVIDGVTYQNTRSRLGQLAKGTQDGFKAGLLKDLQGALDDAAFRSLPDDASRQAWLQARGQYEAFKTVQRAMTSTGKDGAVAGNVSPGQLATAAKQASKNFATGAGELNDLARIGAAFLRDPVGNSGTPQRLLYQSLLSGGAGAAGGLPGVAASLVAPKVAQAAYTSKVGQKYLTDGAKRVADAALPVGKLATGVGVVATDAANSSEPLKVTITPDDALPVVNLPQVGPQSSGGFLDKVAQAESGGNPNAKNTQPGVTASGLMGFNDPTWKLAVAKWGAETGITVRDKNKPEAQRVMAEKLAGEHRDKFTAWVGKPPTDGQLYLLHALGWADGKKLLTAAAAKPQTPAATLFSDNVVGKNRPWFFDGRRPKTALEVYETLTKKVS